MHVGPLYSRQLAAKRGIPFLFLIGLLALKLMVSSASVPIAAPLAHRVSADVDALQVARVCCEVLQEINTALCPIIGLRGVVALYNRSVHLTSTQWEILAANTASAASDRLETSALHALLARCSLVEAVACGNALLHTFYQLLSDLIGASLTERLLRSVWGPPLSSAPAQDTSS